MTRPRTNKGRDYDIARRAIFVARETASDETVKRSLVARSQCPTFGSAPFYLSRSFRLASLPDREVPWSPKALPR
jgi:hypothetical protein